VIIEKPDSISYEQIQATIHSAHESNKEKGLNYGVADQSSDYLKKDIDKNSICYVAMDGDKIAGTCTMTIRTKKLLFIKVKMAYLQFFAVSPEYKGHHLGARLFDHRMQEAKRLGYKYLYGNSAEDNLIIRHIYLQRGFLKAYYAKSKRNNFFAVGYLKTPYNNSKLFRGLVNLYFNRNRKKIRRKYNADD
jgi:GNAT superfamily N-acetyltransferase